MRLRRCFRSFLRTTRQSRLVHRVSLASLALSVNQAFPALPANLVSQIRRVSLASLALSVNRVSPGHPVSPAFPVLSVNQASPTHPVSPAFLALSASRVSQHPASRGSHRLWYIPRLPLHHQCQHH